MASSAGVQWRAAAVPWAAVAAGGSGGAGDCDWAAWAMKLLCLLVRLLMVVLKKKRRTTKKERAQERRETLGTLFLGSHSPWLGLGIPQIASASRARDL